MALRARTAIALSNVDVTSLFGSARFGTDWTAASGTDEHQH